MYKNKDKKKNSRVWGQLLLTVVGFMILLIIVLPLFKNINKQYKVNQEIKDLQNEIIALEKNNQDLLKLINFLESDQFITEQARLKLNYKKEGEDVVVIKDKEDTANKMKIFESGKRPEENLNNPERWLRFFIKPNS